MMTHSLNVMASRTSAMILAVSIPNLQTVCKIIPVQVMSSNSERFMRMAEL